MLQFRHMIVILCNPGFYSVVPDAPASLTQQARSSEEMTIAWEPPVFVPCEIVGYTVSVDFLSYFEEKKADNLFYGW